MTSILRKTSLGQRLADVLCFLRGESTSLNLRPRVESELRPGNTGQKFTAAVGLPHGAFIPELTMRAFTFATSIIAAFLLCLASAGAAGPSHGGGGQAGGAHAGAGHAGGGARGAHVG